MARPFDPLIFDPRIFDTGGLVPTRKRGPLRDYQYTDQRYYPARSIPTR